MFEAELACDLMSDPISDAHLVPLIPTQIKFTAAVLAIACVTLAFVCQAQEYDDEGYGGQGGQGGSGQNDGDGYQNGYGNEDGYSAPNNYQQGVDSDSSNGSPSNYSPQDGGDADGDYEGDDGSAAASSPEPTVVRMKRSVGSQTLTSESTAPKLRVKRHGKYYIGPVYTYVKTDKHANFKWGVSMKWTLVALMIVLTNSLLF